MARTVDPWNWTAGLACIAEGGAAVAQTVAAQTMDTWNWTAGINYRQSANLTFRPEIRYDWYDGWDANTAAPADDSFKFGIDAVMTF